MVDQNLATHRKIQNLIRTLDRERHVEPFDMEAESSRLSGLTGHTYPSGDGPMTVISETNSEVYYFQGGLLFCMHKSGFNSLINGRVSPESRAPSPSKSRYRRLNEMEVEFILGILSAIDPMACWTLLGSDLPGFVARNRKNLNKWTVKIVSLLLAQRLLKRYALRLYQKVSGVLVDGAWSKISESVMTDDAYIARFTGYLLGSYRSEELMEKVINSRWSIFFHVLKRVASAAASNSDSGRTPETMKAQIRDICRSFQNLGVNVSPSEAQIFLKEAEQHPNEIGKAVEILREVFDE